MAQYNKPPFTEAKFGYPLESDVGGRSLDDPEQLVYTINNTIRDYWPINQVPSSLVPMLQELGKLGSQFRMQALHIMKTANTRARDIPPEIG